MGLSFDEYLTLERTADYKSEFHAGEIYAMPGGTPTHSELSARMIVVLSQQVRGCRIFDSNLRLYIEQMQQGVYPDCMAVCGALQFWNDCRDVVLNPTLVVEVLSPSTEKYDKEIKAHYYRSIPSVQHILLVSQERIKIEHFSRTDERTWTLTNYSGKAASVPLLGVELALGEIYGTILDS